MKAVSVLALVVLVLVGCNIDKLLNGGKTPPSDAPPARVAFSSSLGSARAGEPITPPVQVTVQDSAGRVTLRDTLVTLSLGANPSGDSLRGTKQVRSVNGVATFAELRLDKAASGYTLAAAAPELHPDTSSAFSVMPAPATQLLFTVQPSGAMQGSAITPPIQVTAYDSLGNKATDFTGSIRLRIGTDGSVAKNAGIAGAVAPAVAGVATFPDVRIDQVGVGYTLTAAFGSAAPVATSAAFNITPGPPPPPPPPTHLGFTQQPQTTVAGATITPPVQVAALDADEHVVQGFTGTITLALGANPGGGTLSGGAPVSAVNGVATFPSLSIDKAGTGYTLRATASTLTAATSNTFDVTAPPSGSLRVTTSTSGENLDSDGYTVTVDGTTSQPIAINNGSGVTFSGLSVSSHTVELSGVAANCTVTAPNPRSVAVTAGGIATTTFTITCTGLPPPTGDLTVTAATTGQDLDPTGYTVTVDGGQSRSLGVNASTTYTGLTATSHTVELTGVAANCTVSGQNPRTVTVATSGTTTTFTITCSALPPPTGDLTVTAATTGQDLDATGYTVTVDGGQSRSLGINASTTYTGLTAASHTVELTGVAANCTVSGQNPRTVTVATSGTTTTFTITCTALPPPTGDLTVTAATTGQDLDPTGYTVTVDGGQSRSLGVNASTTYTGLTAANHTVELTGLAANCTVSGQNPRTVSVPTSGTTTTFTITCTALSGSLTVTTSTTGLSLDLDGYTVTVDGTTSQTVSNNGSVTFNGLSAGGHTVALSGVAANCTVSGGTSQTVTVPAGGTASAAFSVSCTALPGDLTVSTSTSGGTPDPDGYTVTLDGGPSQAIVPNGSTTFTGLTAGSHTVVLSGIASNCTVSGGTSRTVNVPAGGTGTASYSISCPTPPPPTGNLTVTTNTTGGTPDPDGYTVSVSGGGSQPIDPDGSVTFSDLATGSHTVTLSGIASNCTVSGGTSRTVTVTEGGTASVGYSIDCPTPPPPTGDLTVNTSTSGGTPDPDGYTVSVSGGGSQSIPIDGSVTFTGLAAGSHTVTLSGIAANCTVSGGTSRTVTVTEGGTASVSYSIDCPTPPPPTGDLTVNTSTSGGTPDPDGYTVSVSGAGSQSIPIDGSVTFTGLAAGSHTVTLGGLAANCTVSGGTSQTVNVPAGGTGTVSFAVSCPTPPPPNQPPSVNAGPDETAVTGLLYSLTWSFSDGNHNGPWSYTINWGDGSTSSGTVSSEGSFSAGHTYVILLPRSFTITVTVTDASGAPGSDSKVVSVLLL
jgi:hypothetical protein